MHEVTCGSEVLTMPKLPVEFMAPCTIGSMEYSVLAAKALGATPSVAIMHRSKRCGQVLQFFVIDCPGPPFAPPRHDGDGVQYSCIDGLDTYLGLQEVNARFHDVHFSSVSVAAKDALLNKTDRERL